MVSRATFRRNILYGNKKQSLFKLAGGYTPSLRGLPQSRVRQELIAERKEQTAGRALQLLETARNYRTIDPSLFQRNSPVYFFKKGLKFGKWEKGHFLELEPHSVSMSQILLQRPANQGSLR